MMFSTDETNEHFQLAARFVNQTSRHIFLTGKAGTGKTTFLKYIRENSHKKMAVVAPTGVAAINAGGVTLHSFFQLPFGGFIPSLTAAWNTNNSLNTPDSLLRNLRISSARKELFRELELLVIDEVSMLRADLLDEVDTILRHYRKQPALPFGGVQLLYIGDLFQLPPVISAEEWNWLKEHYKSPFFFDAQVLQQSPPLYLELKKIYRQHDAEFIDILNNIRNNESTEKDLERLHKHYLPGYEQIGDEDIITLTTHNAKADAINQNRLKALPGKLYEYKGELSGEFSERALPGDKLLQLKEGAQVMFIKNDKGEARRYYNGKLAIVTRLAKESITVRFADEPKELELEKEVWRNIRYNYDKHNDNIEEEELGTYTQYPIRLAWAITIHKSQGLTFTKAIIDAGESFAPGQVYVAMSRLTSLDGLILFSKIRPGCIDTDPRVLEFTRREKSGQQLQKELEEEQMVFIGLSLLQSFDWSNLMEQVREHYEQYDRRQIPNKTESVQWARNLLDKINDYQIMAGKFIKQLEQLLAPGFVTNYSHLHERVVAANGYFSKGLDEMISLLEVHSRGVSKKRKVRSYLKSLRELMLVPRRMKLRLQQSVKITEGLMQGESTTGLMRQMEELKKLMPVNVDEINDESRAKPQKGETYRASLQMFKEGNDIATIARTRGLAVSTVEGHLARFVGTGEIEIEKLVSKQKIDIILRVISETEKGTAADLKQRIGESCSYGEIRAVMQYSESRKEVE
jgi:hypothetical protein